MQLQDLVLQLLNPRAAYRMIVSLTSPTPPETLIRRIRQEYQRRRAQAHGWVWAQGENYSGDWASAYKMSCLQFERIEHLDREINRVFHIIAWLKNYSTTDAFTAFKTDTIADQSAVIAVVIVIMTGPFTLSFMLDLDEDDIYVSLEVEDDRVMADTHLAHVTPEGFVTLVPHVLRELTCNLYALAPLVADNLSRVTKTILKNILDQRIRYPPALERYAYVEGEEDYTFLLHLELHELENFLP